ncbi:DUF1501 domain-containing protein [Lignipirellula cremea]|uniref:DUF1501 domain-containing protein n=1 Tax=Lignipirellula cremea TaxID=2528010 RepID=A0A518DQ48_9BACT|nr:DUF1501 domain-containing protein [Lignipirellula cremea]QDU93953.1 hypothetical protein Pla8534_17390 [Lignipirellula cremea]
MLTILDPAGKKEKLCDGVSRRNFLKIGAMGAAGLTLPQLLSLEAAAGIKNSKKSVILVYLVGGPPHQDMFDLKPEAPAEVAGPWRPIPTNVDGVEIGELLPMMSRMMDKFTVIRSLADAQSGHDAVQCYTGRTRGGKMPAGGWPQFGSAVAKLQGPANVATPPYISMCYECTHGPYNEPGPGFLGAVQSPFRPLGPTRSDMILQGVTTDRLADRQNLLGSLDNYRRDVDNSGMMDGFDAFTQQAMGVLTSSRLADALDLSTEDPKLVERYGVGDTKKHMDGNGAPRVPQSFLAARRLVEAGARVVTVNYSKWDWHGGTNNSIFKREQEDFPVFDQGITALVEDLHNRGMADDTAVLVWGEFGRTPKISAQVGRDHWPRVACALMAGGGWRNGQVIGATDRLGGEPVDRPVKFQEVFATLYNHLGIDVRQATVPDLHGRPQYLVEPGVQPLRELV